MLKSTFNEILKFVIEEKEKAYLRYRNLAEWVKDREAKKYMDIIANEEKKHLEELINLRNSSLIPTNHKNKYVRLKGTYYSSDCGQIESDSDYKQVLKAAICEEEKNAQIYCDMAYHAPTHDIFELFMFFNQQEMEHKKILEEKLSLGGFHNSNKKLK
ncbi:MAG: hypothetical protein ABIA63_09135 [bacterium]